MKLIILSFIVIFSYAKYDSKFILQWNNILHLENKTFSQQSFYLSYPYVNWENELILDLNEIKNKNKNFICAFPYRYVFLSKYFHLSKFNIMKNCPKVNFFLHSFQKDKVGIVFSSEYSMSPQSAFGHVMLIFKDNNKSLLTSDVVHFAAVVKKEGFFKYSYNGLTGKFPAFYIREKLFKKYYLYNLIQQRSMFIYWLNFNKKDIQNLILHIYELNKFKAHYYFLNYNCSTAIIELLNSIKLEQNYDHLIILPIKSVSLYHKNIKHIQKLIPLDKQLLLLYQKMDYKEKNIFNQIVLMKYKGNFKSLSNIIKEASVKLYQYMFYNKKMVYPNYNEVSKLNYQKEKLNLKKIKNPLQKTLPCEIYFFKDIKNNNYLFTLRPFLISKYDIENNLLEEKVYNIFTPTFLVKKHNLKLQQFDLINSESMIKNYSFIKDISWKLYAGLNRENYNNNLTGEIELGFGNTYPINNQFFINYLINGGIDFGDFNNIYIKPEINVVLYSNNKLKIENNLNYKVFINRKIYYQNDIFFSAKIAKQLIGIISYIKESENNKLLVGLGYNF